MGDDYATAHLDGCRSNQLSVIQFAELLVFTTSNVSAHRRLLDGSSWSVNKMPARSREEYVTQTVGNRAGIIRVGFLPSMPG